MPHFSGLGDRVQFCGFPNSGPKLLPVKLATTTVDDSAGLLNAASRFAVAGEFDKLRFAVAGHYREKQKRHFVIAITLALEGVIKVKWS